MDNLFLVRDIIDIASLNGKNFCIFVIDQEKAFDRVSHFYLFKTLEVFWGLVRVSSHGLKCCIMTHLQC